MSTAGTGSGDTCEGCEERGAPEPSPLYNRPGLPALSYRVGTHASFLQRMMARLSREALPDGAFEGERPMARLSTRSPEDPSIALLDAWATAADVLTFYQERIANEGFLRTATERRSVLELTRQIGYELSPGVAASTYLAFSVETAPGAPERVQVGRGIQVLSIPGQDERPQTFETLEPLEARAAWNEMRPLLTAPQEFTPYTQELYLQGLQTGIQPGDMILLVGQEREFDAGSEQWDLRQVKAVTLVNNTQEPSLSHTVVTWELALGSRQPPMIPAQQLPRAFVLRLRANLFGYNAPDFRVMPKEIKLIFNKDYREGDARFTQWPNFETQTASERMVDLDREYPTIIQGSWLVLQKADYIELYRVEEVKPWARVDFTLTAKVSRVKLDTSEHLSWFPLRGTAVLAQSEELPIGRVPLFSYLGGNLIKLDRRVEGLQEGRLLIVEGRPYSPGKGEDGWVREVAVLDGASVGEDGLTTLRLKENLAHELDLATVRIWGNVVRSTHGETVREVLGGGDGSRAHQRFTLRRPPLTYVPAPSATGGQSTLEIWVNGVRWKEVPTLFDQGPHDEVYMVRHQADGTVSVMFGDGQSGARLPTGQENVSAVYRSGIGPEGEVQRGQLALLQVRPLGLREVVNPLRASGSSAPESMEDARAHAPASVLTLQRVVSLQDYEDFAATFAGIGKAQASDLTSGERPLVHITVAATSGTPVDSSSELYKSLVRALEEHRDPVRRFLVGSYEEILFNVSAVLRIDPRYSSEAVLSRVEAALRAAFSFARRHFAQPVSAAEVIQVMQGVEGVVMVDLDTLYPSVGTDPELSSLLQALPARWVGTEVPQPAQLLLLNPAREGVVLMDAANLPEGPEERRRALQGMRAKKGVRS